MWRLLFLALFTKTSLAYKAAVLEYYPITSSTANETILENLKNYQNYADNAQQHAVEIIVFPEYGLTTRTTDVEAYAIEITADNHVIKKLSTIAQERQTYLVVNLLEKSQDKYYNTDLVFDKKGTILLTYRKINLEDESRLTAGSPDQKTTFWATFGATFGIFTGSDILFTNPSRTVLENQDVSAVVFPTAMKSTTPFYHSLNIQHGYAKSNGVNLLSSSYAKPTEGVGGSGIYYADGSVVETYVGDTSSSKLIVQEIVETKRQNTTMCSPFQKFGLPVDLGRLNVTNYNTQRSFSIEKYETQRLDLGQNRTVAELCQRDFCCNFDVSLSTSSVNSSEVYKFVVFDDVADYPSNNAHIRICGLVACENEDDNSCGKRFNTTTRFTKITIDGTVPFDDTAFYTPVTLNYYLLPIKNTQYCNNNNSGNFTNITFTTIKPQENLLVFGLFGRTDVPIVLPTDPNNDNKNDGGNYAVSIRAGFSCILLFILTKLLVL